MEIPLCTERVRDLFTERLEATESIVSVQEPVPLSEDSTEPKYRDATRYEYRLKNGAGLKFGKGNELFFLGSPFFLEQSAPIGSPIHCGNLNDLKVDFKRPSATHFYSFSHHLEASPGKIELLRMTGFISHDKKAKVRAEITAALPFAQRRDHYNTSEQRWVKQRNGKWIQLFTLTRAPEATPEQTVEKQKWWDTHLGRRDVVELKISIKDGDDWKEVERKDLTYSAFYKGITTEVLEAVVEPQSVVRFTVSTSFHGIPKHKNDDSVGQEFHLHDAKLFGAQCYPDFANPDKCLEDRE